MRARLVADGTLAALERFAILDDAWAAVLAGSATTAGFVDLLRDFCFPGSGEVYAVLGLQLRA